MHSTPLDGRQDRGQSLVVLSSQLQPGAAHGSADSTRTGLLVEVDGVKLRKTDGSCVKSGQRLACRIRIAAE